MKFLLFKWVFWFYTDKNSLTDTSEPDSRASNPTTEDPLDLPVSQVGLRQSQWCSKQAGKKHSSASRYAAALLLVSSCLASPPPHSLLSANSFFKPIKKPSLRKTEILSPLPGWSNKRQGLLSPACPELEKSRFQSIHREHEYQRVERYSRGEGEISPEKLYSFSVVTSDPYEERTEEDFN